MTTTTEHPRLVSTRDAFEALKTGDLEPILAQTSDEVVMVNDLGSGPWRELRGKKAVLEFFYSFVGIFEGTFAQDVLGGWGWDDGVVLLIHEHGTANGVAFDNRAIYMFVAGPDGRWRELRTMDMDRAHLEQFWTRWTSSS
ncbi:nuclear transport factor 2 family protein [Actinomycetospora endophytica]|uniref:Nuclear transport factor 2 family protein n=1 Tax=Actinomycetospora endophytica TaxID=2291215 RepID=A0ABS8P1N8_9PSEU|nr:nuclear transport factor 2 family protein [Actinomycetospora endophytica]MCD2192149.1 nuclear transport factor 2 family protein [Actinomycetospora endophytica]